jgi:hypothetical protein
VFIKLVSYFNTKPSTYACMYLITFLMFDFLTTSQGYNGKVYYNEKLDTFAYLSISLNPRLKLTTF